MVSIHCPLVSLTQSTFYRRYLKIALRTYGTPRYKLKGNHYFKSCLIIYIQVSLVQSSSPLSVSEVRKTEIDFFRRKREKINAPFLFAIQSPCVYNSLFRPFSWETPEIFERKVKYIYNLIYTRYR